MPASEIPFWSQTECASCLRRLCAFQKASSPESQHAILIVKRLSILCLNLGFGKVLRIHDRTLYKRSSYSIMLCQNAILRPCVRVHMLVRPVIRLTKLHPLSPAELSSKPLRSFAFSVLRPDRVDCRRMVVGSSGVVELPGKERVSPCERRGGTDSIPKIHSQQYRRTQVVRWTTAQKHAISAY